MSDLAGMTFHRLRTRRAGLGANELLAGFTARILERNMRNDVHRPYLPTDADLETSQSWRRERDLEAAWRSFRKFNDDERWSGDGDLPMFLEASEFEHLSLVTRPDARSLVMFEKMSIRRVHEAWTGPAGHAKPSVTHATKAAVLWLPPLASRWTCDVIEAHRRKLRVPFAFFGDLDPQALHAFAALRAGGRERMFDKPRRARRDVKWLGIDDAVLALVCSHFKTNTVPFTMTITLNWLDREYWELVKRLVPDVRQLVGRRSFAMLEQGIKLEADALLQLREPFLDFMRRRLARLGRQAK